MLYVRKASYRTVKPLIIEALQACHFDPGSKPILIKPNVVNAHKPSSGAITHPAIVEALLEYFGGKRCTIAESSVLGTDTDHVLDATGYKRLAARYGANIVNLQNAKRVSVKWRFGELLLPSILFESAYINVAKMKTHILTGVTLCLKNQKGLLLDQDKMRFHRIGLQKAIPALFEVVKPDFAIIDAILALEGEGPGRLGTPKEVGLILAGDDALALDNLGLYIMGFEPGEIEHIPVVELTETMGERPEAVRRRFKRSKGYYRKGKLYYFPFGACSGCSNSISSAIKALPGHPLKLARFLLKAILRKRVFIAGINARFPDCGGEILCVGDCASKFARDNNLPLVPGCPPKPQDILGML